MLFNGGGCGQSANIQDSTKFQCRDVGVVPSVVGSEAHILVTDIKGQGIIYFDGIVRVGDFFPLRDGTERFEADQFITISTPDQRTVLQEIQYHSSCSQNLELNNKFGSLQLVSFFNEVQGNVTSFNVLEFSLDIDVPITVLGERVQLTRLIANTNFAGPIDLTSQVAGQTATNDGTIAVTLSGSINTAERREYVIQFDIAGIRASDGAVCVGMNTLAFQAGNVPGSNPPPIVQPPSPSMGSMGGSMTEISEAPPGSMTEGSMGMVSEAPMTGSMGTSTGEEGMGEAGEDTTAEVGSMSSMGSGEGSMRRRRRLFAW
jgi:hypothetical protein